MKFLQKSETALPCIKAYTSDCERAQLVPAQLVGVSLRTCMHSQMVVASKPAVSQISHHFMRHRNPVVAEWVYKQSMQLHEPVNFCIKNREVSCTNCYVHFMSETSFHRRQIGTAALPG